MGIIAKTSVAALFIAAAILIVYLVTKKEGSKALEIPFNIGEFIKIQAGTETYRQEGKSWRQIEWKIIDEPVAMVVIGFEGSKIVAINPNDPYKTMFRFAISGVKTI